MEVENLEHQALLRTVKTAEEQFLLYQRKQEEARISDALDVRRVANVAVAEAATQPRSPSGLPATLLMLGALAVAGVAGLGAGYGRHALNPHFRTPDEVRRVLHVPVLATLPAGTEGSDVRAVLRPS